MENKKLNIDEFRNLGYLQEVNRRFFHPLGLALSISLDDDGNTTLHSILDFRDDPEGGEYGLMDSDNERIIRFNQNKDFIDLELLKREEVRISMFGNLIEPIPEDSKNV